MAQVANELARSFWQTLTLVLERSLVIRYCYGASNGRVSLAEHPFIQAVIRRSIFRWQRERNLSNELSPPMRATSKKEW